MMTKVKRVVKRPRTRVQLGKWDRSGKYGSTTWTRIYNLAVVEPKLYQRQAELATGLTETERNFVPFSDHSLGPVVQALSRPSQQNLELVDSLVKQMANGDGIEVLPNRAHELRTPAEGIPYWVVKMESERYSERTIRVVPTPMTPAQLMNIATSRS